MRFLRPANLIPLESGLWVIDEFQPVTAILDPRSGAIRQVVSWPQLPPAPTRHDWPGPAVMGDGTSLWAQQHRSGPLVRVGPGGVDMAVWTGGLKLAACGPGEAWCEPAPPHQALVKGKNAQFRMLAHSGLSRLLRIRADGRQDTVTIDRPVRELYATPDTLVIRVDDDPGQLRHLGADEYEIVWTSRYLTIPWGGELPESLTAAQHAGPERPADIISVPHGLDMSWYEPTDETGAGLHAAGMRWRLGRTIALGTSAPWYPVLATAHDGTDHITGRFELGLGNVITARPIADDTVLGVALRRPGPTRPVEVLSLQPHQDSVRVLLPGDAVDISAQCWPLVPRPIEADSYAERMLAANNWNGAAGTWPLADGMSEVTTTLEGSWPDTHLQWTFLWSERPGLLLRRRVPLYDELGRPAPPEYASMHLMEDLDTRAIAPASAADQGLLDI